MKLVPPSTASFAVVDLIHGKLSTSTGRLAFMTHDEFVQLIESYSGTWVPTSVHAPDQALLVGNCYTNRNDPPGLFDRRGATPTSLIVHPTAISSAA